MEKLKHHNLYVTSLVMLLVNKTIKNIVEGEEGELKDKEIEILDNITAVKVNNELTK